MRLISKTQATHLHSFLWAALGAGALLLLARNQNNTRMHEANPLRPPANPSYVTYVRKNWDGSDLSHLRWHIVLFDRAKLRRSSLRWTEWFGVAARNSSFYQATFEFGTITGASLSRVNMFGADFRMAKIRSALIVDSDFRKADFRAAELSDTYFLNTQLAGALFDDRTALPFSKLEAERRGMEYVR